MTQASSTVRPSRRSCRELLAATPAIGAFRRALYRTAPADSRGWLGALGVISRHADGVRASQVAELLHVDLSVASRHVTQLEALGYVSRAADPDDRRASLLHATDEGRVWLDAFADEFASEMRDWLAGWSDAEVASFTAQLQRFGSSLEAAQR